MESRWEKLTCRGEGPFLLQEHTMVGHDGRLYVFGGEFACNGVAETPLWILDLSEYSSVQMIRLRVSREL